MARRRRRKPALRETRSPGAVKPEPPAVGPGAAEKLASAAGQKLKEAVATLFELPRDAILDLPRLTLIGNLQLTVENHRGLVEYTPQRIRIATQGDGLEVTGQGLRIGSVYREELIISGRIETVRYGS